MGACEARFALLKTTLCKKGGTLPLTDRKCRARRMEGLIGRASRLDQSERSRRTRGLRCRGGGNFGP